MVKLFMHHNYLLYIPDTLYIQDTIMCFSPYGFIKNQLFRIVSVQR